MQEVLNFWVIAQELLKTYNITGNKGYSTRSTKNSVIAQEVHLH